jgi:hypothetical protein
MECRVVHTRTNTLANTNTNTSTDVSRISNYATRRHCLPFLYIITHANIPVHWVCIVINFLLDLLVSYFGFGFKKFVQEHRNNHLLSFMISRTKYVSMAIRSSSI